MLIQQRMVELVGKRMRMRGFGFADSLGMVHRRNKDSALLAHLTVIMNMQV